MKGIIVYDEFSLQKNYFFANKLRQELNNLGVQTEIVNATQGFSLDELKPDFAVMRVYDEKINELLDGQKIRTFNNSFVAKVCNDKWKTFLLLSDNGIRVAPTFLTDNCDLPFPRIVKSRHGHGGSEVFWASDKKQFDRIMARLKDSAIVQPPVGKRGRDLRVYVIGGEPIVGMLRKSDVDFRSNFSLGGRANRYELSNNEKALIGRIAKLLDLDFAGIDFLLDKDGLICNEIEDVVGCRMVYTYTDIDIIKKYAEHIVCSLKSGKNA